MAHAPPTPGHDPVDAALTAARHVLPDQGPIGVFIHHNTLHAFQHLSFHEAVQAGAALTGARPYLDLDEYREAFRTGRIEARDLDGALQQSLGAADDAPSGLGLTRHAFRRLLMLEDPATPDPAGLAFLLGREGGDPDGALRYAACREAVHRCPPPPAPAPPPAPHHQDILRAAGGGDTNLTVHRELIRLCAGFLDQGQALTSMPGREQGFLRAVATLHASGAASPREAPGIAADFAGIHRTGADARAVIAEGLEALGVRGDDVEPFLRRVALALPGWGGMFDRLERHPEEGTAEAPASFLDFVAVRLVIERRAIEHAARTLGLPADLSALRATRPVRAPPEGDTRAVRLYHLTRAAGLGVRDLQHLDAAQLSIVWAEMEAFPMLQRRATWHEAYEGWYRRSILDALAARRALGPRARPARPTAQFVFCIDEREESIRRAIEEQGADLETFGAAGFFGVAIDYQGLYDAAPAAHCPVVVTPDHEVHEAPMYTAHGWHALRLRLRDAWHGLHRGAHRRSRTLSGGLGLSLVLGPLAAAVALARVVAPRASLGWYTRLRHRLAPRPATRLSTLRPADDRSPRGKLVGFSLTEATDRVAGTLRAIGLVDGFAPVVVLLGHGSTSLNNPHESAHDCGACGGRRGGANARLFADMANRPEVRDSLRQRGIVIPADTWFIGGLHDTADDGVHYHDLDLLPQQLYLAFAKADGVLQLARQLSAQERCRRFHDAPLGITPAEALRHVEARASHLGQPRPEYGHCTNAIAVVGRRELTRGLHLDRRPFLVSYDPSTDPQSAILERTLAAVGPVGAGISLEYYFSSVDNEVYGCGTKLPHNVTALLGVMNGHMSDLRTGLPLQMVELHEPMRLLLIVEATPEALLQVASRQAEVRELVVNEWVQLVSLDPLTGEMRTFAGGRFVPYTPGASPLPRVRRSVEWHGQSRDHLRPAIVEAALADSTGGVARDAARDLDLVHA